MNRVSRGVACFGWFMRVLVVVGYWRLMRAVIKYRALSLVIFCGALSALEDGG